MQTKLNTPIFYLLLLSLSSVTLAAEPVSKSRFGGVAIGGHDTVAYHQQTPDQHLAAKGKGSYVVEWKGAKWRFATLADSETFAANPEKYSPAYNGFCANSLSLGKGLLKTDGSHWRIFDDQLYLFYAQKGEDRWTAGDYAEYKHLADRAWQDILVSEEN